jgi:hypothetical protein
MLNKIIRLNLADLWAGCGVVGGAFVLIHLITGAVIAIAKPSTSISLSGTLLPVIAGFFIFGFALVHVMLSFDLCVRFGSTRKRALRLTLGLAGFESVCIMGLAALLTRVEHLLIERIWLRVLTKSPDLTSGVQAALVKRMGLEWYWFALIALGALLLGLVAGAFLKRFGRKGFWVMWAAYLGALFLPERLSPASPVIDWLLPGFVVALILGTIWSVWSLLHATVKQ